MLKTIVSNRQKQSNSKKSSQLSVFVDKNKEFSKSFYFYTLSVFILLSITPVSASELLGQITLSPTAPITVNASIEQKASLEPGVLLFESSVTSKWKLAPLQKLQIDLSYDRTLSDMYEAYILYPDATHENAELKFSASFFNPELRQKLLVHELTHAVLHFYQPNEKTWIQEGWTLLAEWFASGRSHAGEQMAFQNPEISLLSEPAKATISQQYGQWSLFFRFWYEHCDGIGVVGDGMKNGFERIFLNRNSNLPAECHSFHETFKEFEIRKHLQAWDRHLPYPNFNSKPFAERLDSLPSYSGRPYYPNPRCDARDLSLNANLCLQIRYE